MAPTNPICLFCGSPAKSRTMMFGPRKVSLPPAQICEECVEEFHKQLPGLHAHLRGRRLSSASRIRRVRIQSQWFEVSPGSFKYDDEGAIGFSFIDAQTGSSVTGNLDEVSKTEF